LKILLNGLGRIGKAILLNALKLNIKIRAINEAIKDLNNLAYILNYDSTYGKSEFEFSVEGDNLIVNNQKIKLFNKDLNEIYNEFDLIIEASGAYKDFKRGRVLFTYPNKNALNIIYGVNEDILKNQNLISASSCNANALYPVLFEIDKAFKIINGDIITIHPLLNHQKTLDGKCIESNERDVECNYEFGRSSVFNLIPSHTTTLKAIGLIEKKFEEILTSSSIRTPIDTVGAINVVLWLEKEVSKEDIIKTLSKNKIIKINKSPLVSSDFKKEEFSIIDKRFLQVKKNMVKLVIWYDNEWGYAKRVVKLIGKING